MRIEIQRADHDKTQDGWLVSERVKKRVIQDTYEIVVFIC